jgi:hypothetical protein
MPGDEAHEAHVERVRCAVEHLPEVVERLSHGAPTFFVRGKKSFASVWPEGHHDDAFPHLCLAAPNGVQAELIAEDPARFFRPPYVGHLGWIGLRLDQPTKGDELVELCEDAYRTVAPATLVRRLDEQSDNA